MTRFPEPAFTLSLKVRVRFAPTATLVELSAGLVVDRGGGVVSGGGAVITSSLFMAGPDGPGLAPALLVAAAAVPVISHTRARPPPSCPLISTLPSPVT